jgi:hypothetical protein
MKTGGRNMSETALLQGVFTGRVAFSQLIRDALQQAATEGWKQMVWSDVNFEDWPLHEKVVSDALYAWSKSGRQLIMISKNYNSILKYKHRMVVWRQKWGHIVDARLLKQMEDDRFPSVLWSPGWFMQRQELENFQGFATTDRAKGVQCQELLSGLYQRSSPGFPASVLGL